MRTSARSSPARCRARARARGGLAHTRRAQAQETSGGSWCHAQPRAGPPQRRGQRAHGVVLADDLLPQRCLQAPEAGPLVLGQRAQRHAAPGGHHARHFTGAHRGGSGQLRPRRSLVERVDGLVGQAALGQVATGETHRRSHRVVVEQDAVMGGDGGGARRGHGHGGGLVGLLHHQRMEAAAERRVTRQVAARVVEGGGADAAQGAATERGLEQRADGGRLPGREQLVHLVDEQDALAARLERREQLDHSLLEVAAEPRATEQRAHVERQQPRVPQRGRRR